MYEVTYIEDGKKIKSEFIGTEEEIRNRLHRQGKVVLELKKPLILLKRYSREEACVILIALSDLLKVDTKIVSALESIIKTLSANSPFKAVLYAIANAVNEGRNLSHAMESYKHIFGHTTIAMLKSGDETGKLEETLRAAANHLKNIEETKKETIGRMAYPAVVMVVSIVMLFLSTTIFIPKIVNSDIFQYASKGQRGMSVEFLSYMGYIAPIVFILFFLFAVAAIAFYKTKQETFERFLIRIPFLRELIFYRSYYIAFYSLPRLMEVGINIEPAFEIVKNATDSLIVKKELQGAIDHLRRGESFVKGLNSINDIERTMLGQADQHDSKKVCENLSTVSDRFYRQYIKKVKSIAPRLQALSYAFVIGTFLAMLMGLLIPLFRMMPSIR